MIKIEQVSKRFGSVQAIKDLSCSIEAGSIFGLIGSNGAGKSTLLRILAGIYKADQGSVSLNGTIIFDNPAVKAEIVMVPDQPAFLPQANLSEMATFYAGIYPNWDTEFFKELCELFPLDRKIPLVRLSKGVQRQACLILALSVRPQLLLLDEAFDGLDPVRRQQLKKVLASEVAQRDLTVIVASHNLRELEEFCDQVGLIHEGEILFRHDLDSLKSEVFKLQLAFSSEITQADLQKLDLQILHYERRGSLLMLVLRGTAIGIADKFVPLNPLFLDLLPLSLEEIFIYELEGKGYAVHDLVEKEGK